VNVARAVAVVAALAAGAIGLVRGTWAVGGSDSSCYALMAAAFASGRLQPTSPLAVEAPWPDAQRTLAPGGFVPSPVRGDAASPICAPGFSLLLAPLYVAGGRDAIFLLTPVAGAALVWLTFLFGRQLAGDVAGAAAAVLTASMPVFVFQLVQPMNDVVVAALWMAVLALAARPSDHTAAIGALTGLAILVRPSLAPAAIPVAIWCGARGRMRLMTFAAAAAPFLCGVVVLNALLYGHPMQTGYGATSDLFALSHVGANVRNYTSALLRTQLGLPLLGVAAVAVAPRPLRPTVGLALGVAAAIVIVHLFYRPFPEWWYLRFLLPALATLNVLAMATPLFGTRRASIAVPVALIAGLYGASSHAMDQALDLARLERRFRTVGEVARERLPSNSVFLAVWDSGSLQYHAARPAVLWDSLPPGSLDAAVTWLAGRGLEPYIVMEEWEEPLFRERFARHSVLGELDWPPQFDVERRVRIFKPADRARYFGGESVPTEYVRPNR
jgi:hypothetical protein